jgi:hypothetical protein
MESFKVFDSNKNKNSWNELINQNQFSNLDIYYSPDYINLYTNKLNKGLMFYYEENNKKWFIPCIKKQIEIKNKIFNDYYDLETPYGYGGPISNSKDKNFIRNATDSFIKWCNSEKIINFIIKFHPVIKNEEMFFSKDNLILDRKTLEIDLSKKNFIYDELITSKVRNMINRVKKDNVIIEINNSKSVINQIKEMYIKKMRQKNAKEFYFFNDDYFTKLSDIVNRNGWCITASTKFELLGFAIFLNYNQKSSYHLSSTINSKKYPGLTNSIIKKAVDSAQLYGFDSINLGGGNTSNEQDSLYKFKLRMSNKKNNFFIYKKVLDKKAYKVLIEYWNKTFPELRKKYKDYLQCYRLNN